MRSFLRILVLGTLAIAVLAGLLLVRLFLLIVDLIQLFTRPAEPVPVYRRDSGSEVARPKDRDQVLVIQSAEPELILRTLEKQRDIGQESCVTVFCRNRSEILKHFVGNIRIDQVLIHSETQAWWSHLKSLRRQRFQTVVVFFTGDPSYWKIKFFAFLVGARRKVIVDGNGNCFILSWSSWFRLFERDLVIWGMFQSNSWKMNRSRRRLAELYRSISGLNRKPVPAPISNQTEAPPGDAAPQPATTESLRLTNYKDVLTSILKTSLRSFLSSGTRLSLPSDSKPEISVLLVLFNRAELTFQCLRSLTENHGGSLEIIIVDNASSDETTMLLDRIDGATIIRNTENLHFILGSNQAAAKARGRYILFLNNDAQVLPGTIRAAVNCIESSPDIGAVGARLILPDGSLQEAGSIVWHDGSCIGYGRGEDPLSPMYMFRRDVDYCSGAFLLTKRDLFNRLGGFQELYRPAYYEETDFCARLWENGFRVVYEPDAAVLHYEFASSSYADNAKELHRRNQTFFLECHRDWLNTRYDFGDQNVLPARAAINPPHRVLFIDDRVPHPSLGSGLPRSNAILRALVNVGCFVTFYPTDFIHEEWRDVYEDIPREVEVMVGYGAARLQRFLASRNDYYDVILISRPHNVELCFRPVYRARPEWFRNTKIIYDAEAIFSSRDIGYRRLRGEALPDSDVEQLTKSEIELASIANSVLAVSDYERQVFINNGIQDVHVLGHTLIASPTWNRFEDRVGLLFVGAIQGEESPNGDAVLWFLRETLSQIRGVLGSVPFRVAGRCTLDIPQALLDRNIEILGKVDDLTAAYNQARVFVAPTRFSAGIPHKIHEAAARGVPVVATSLLANQLGWSNGDQLLVGDDPRSFAEQCIRLYTDASLWQRIRNSALERVQQECSEERFRATLRAVLNETVAAADRITGRAQIRLPGSCI
jgi:GT2 family glycosyltransferase